MSANKFAIAQMQRVKAMTQRVKQSQYQSTYKFFKAKENMTADVFERTKKCENEVSPKSILGTITKKVK